MLNKTKAIVLHHVKYGETSIIATLYTERYGRLACMVNGVRSKKARFPATFFQPLSLLDTDFYYRQNRNIQRLKEASSPFHYNTIPFSATKSAVALFLAEVLYLSLHEEESNPVLFSYIYHALQLFDTMDEGSIMFHHWFMLHLTKYLGFFPPVQKLGGSEFLAADIQAFSALSSETAIALKHIADSPQSPPVLVHLSNRDRNELLESIIRYYAKHIDGFSKLNSYAVLQEVFRPISGK